MRIRTPLLLLTAASITGLTGCAALPAAPTVAPAPAVAVDAPPQAQVRFAVDPRDVAGLTPYDLTGVTADGSCSTDAGTTKVSVRDDAAPKGSLEALYLTIPASGPPVVEPTFHSDRGGWSYDTSYATSDGRQGSATATATVRDGRLEVTFDGRTWDGAVFSGTASCPVT
ncbi:hypothetical protein [Pseudonocardia pini]|uniref:hypothetical protein n=1 Tax=Pseudonocardia pini TaxID=2758030 RepID=UPI0015F001CF|nr:hypothetical protein [Pseudonocardia pini]